MDQWEYQMLVVDMGGTGSQLGFVRSTIGKMWQFMGPDGRSDWNRLQSMGREGWNWSPRYRYPRVTATLSRSYSPSSARCSPIPPSKSTRLSPNARP